MTAPNGHAESASPPHVSEDNALASQHLGFNSRLSDDRIRQIIGDLEVPFDSSVIEWRATNTAKDKRRGQVMPYADRKGLHRPSECFIDSSRLDAEIRGSHQRKFPAR